jgi:hypothetical protein
MSMDATLAIGRKSDWGVSCYAPRTAHRFKDDVVAKRKKWKRRRLNGRRRRKSCVRRLGKLKVDGNLLKIVGRNSAFSSDIPVTATEVQHPQL